MFNKLKRKWKRRTQELAPQVTAWEKQGLEAAGAPAGGLPYTTYDLMERDSMVQTALTVKKLGVLAGRFRIAPASDSPGARERAAFVEEAFARMEGSPQTVLAGAMDAFAKGWSVQEMVYEEADGRLWLRAMRPKSPAMFGVGLDAFGSVRSLRLELPGESARELPRGKFVLYAHRASYGRPKGRSDLDAAYPHFAAKSALMSAWRAHLERFGSPTVLGRYQRGVPAQEQADLLAALRDLARTNAVVFPDDIDVSTLSVEREASQGFQEAIDFHNREIARAVLGQTLTTDEGRRVGSLALGKVHLQVLMLQLESLRHSLADSVMTEQVVRPLVELNFGPGEVPRFEFEPTELEAFASGRLT